LNNITRKLNNIYCTIVSKLINSHNSSNRIIQSILKCMPNKIVRLRPVILILKTTKLKKDRVCIAYKNFNFLFQTTYFYYVYTKFLFTPM